MIPYRRAWGASQNDINAIIREIQRAWLNVFNVEGYGATGGDATADTAAFQDAITAAKDAGGGVVYAPATATPYYLDDTLTIDQSFVSLVGEGGVSPWGDDLGGTKFEWHGSGGETMIQVATTPSPTAKLIAGNFVRQIALDGLSSAAECINWTSSTDGGMANINVKGATSAQIHFDCLDNADIGTAHADNQRCEFRDIRWDATGSAHGLLFEGSDISNTSYCTFANLLGGSINGDGIHVLSNHLAWDNNLIFGLQAFVGGTGKGVRERGTANTFVNIDASVVVEGTASGNFFNPIYGIYIMDEANGASAPTFDPGCRGIVIMTGGISTWAGLGVQALAAPSSPSSGWVVYTDSGDGNKLKAKASNGTVVTLGTP